MCRTSISFTLCPHLPSYPHPWSPSCQCPRIFGPLPHPGRCITCLTSHVQHAQQLITLLTTTHAGTTTKSQLEKYIFSHPPANTTPPDNLRYADTYGIGERTLTEEESRMFLQVLMKTARDYLAPYREGEGVEQVSFNKREEEVRKQECSVVVKLAKVVKGIEEKEIEKGRRKSSVEEEMERLMLRSPR